MLHCHVCGNLLQGTEQTCPACGALIASPHLRVGTKLNRGRYSVGRVLGQGGFGITYQGADLTLNRPVAIKEFFPDGSTRHTNLLIPPTSLGTQGLREALDNFLNEARTLAQFNNPSIVRVLDVFEENFTAYLVMELLQGETLAARIQRVDVLPPDEVMTLAKNMADALSTVHSAGLLHRDIKPDNIFLTTDGRSVLIDFGSARGYTSDKTVRHTRLVTPGYAPLEQYTSQAKFGPYTDIYALSATLYHAVTGTQPPPVTDRLAGTPLEPLPQHIPLGLRTAIEQGMAIRIDERPDSVAAFIKLLSKRAAPSRVPGSSASIPVEKAKQGRQNASPSDRSKRQSNQTATGNDPGTPANQQPNKVETAVGYGCLICLIFLVIFGLARAPGLTITLLILGIIVSAIINRVVRGGL
jgi:serine/threonine protein kinase